MRKQKYELISLKLKGSSHRGIIQNVTTDGVKLAPGLEVHLHITFDSYEYGLGKYPIELMLRSKLSGDLFLTIPVITIDGVLFLESEMIDPLYIIKLSELTSLLLENDSASLEFEEEIEKMKVKYPEIEDQIEDPYCSSYTQTSREIMMVVTRAIATSARIHFFAYTDILIGYRLYLNNKEVEGLITYSSEELERYLNIKK